MKKVFALVIAGLIGTSLIGCSSTQKEQEVSIEQEAKEEVKEEKQERVVASSVAVVELLDQLEIEMVGVPTTQYELPESVKDAVEIGSPMKPDMEIIKSLNPTKVITVSSLSPDVAKSFEALGIEVEFLDLNSYGGLKEGITHLGELFGKQDKAQEIIKGFEVREEAITTQIEGKESPEVMIMFGAPGSFMIATETSYVGDLLKQVGGTNIIENQESSYIPVDMEYLANENPDIVLTLTHADPEASKKMFEEEFATNQVWQHFDAVKEGKVYNLPNGYFGMSANLMTIDAMEMLVEMIYE